MSSHPFILNNYFTIVFKVFVNYTSTTCLLKLMCLQATPLNLTFATSSSSYSAIRMSTSAFVPCVAAPLGKLTVTVTVPFNVSGV